MESFIFVSFPIKGVFWQFEWSWVILFGKVHYLFGKIKNSKCKTPLLLGLRQKWGIPSCCLWKVVTFFGKDHVNWSSINRVMKGRSWTIKSIIILVTFSILIFQLHPIITLLILDQLACSLPKTNTTFHQLFKYATKDAKYCKEVKMAMDFFHQLDEKIADTFLAHFHQQWL